MSIVAYEFELPDNIFNSVSASQKNCEHLQTTKTDSGTTVCDNCGLKIDDTMIDNENKFYLTMETRYSKMNQIQDKNIYQELEMLGFPQQINEIANNYYLQIAQDKIYRAKNHTGLMFACVFNAYSDLLESKSAIELGIRFGLNRKKATNGLKMFARYFKHRPEKKYIRPMDLIPQLLYKLKISDVEKKIYIHDLSTIYDHIYQTSQTIRTAIPSSAAAGLLYYYLRLKGITITRNEYSKIVELTVITFIRIAREIVKLIGYKVRL